MLLIHAGLQSWYLLVPYLHSEGAFLPLLTSLALHCLMLPVTDHKNYYMLVLPPRCITCSLLRSLHNGYPEYMSTAKAGYNDQVVKMMCMTPPCCKQGQHQEH